MMESRGCDGEESLGFHQPAASNLAEAGGAGPSLEEERRGLEEKNREDEKKSFVSFMGYFNFLYG